MAGLLDYLSEKYQPENIQQINERLVELSSLFEISQILNSSIELEKVLNNILLIPMGRLLISKGVVFLKSGDSFNLRLRKGLPEGLAKEKLDFDCGDLDIIRLFGDGKNQSPDNLNNLMRKYGLSIGVPLKSKNQVFGIVFFGSKLDNSPFRSEEEDFLISLANLSATTVVNAQQVEEIKQVNFLLDAKIQQLKTLFDIAQGLSATLDSNKIEKLLIYALMGQMLVNHYAMVIFKNSHPEKIENKGFNSDVLESLANDVTSIPDVETAILIKELPPSSFRSRVEQTSAKVFIPMRHQNQLIGFILLGQKINKDTYSVVDLEFLSTLVSQAVVSLENARLFQETLEKQRIEQELQVAKTIQKKLLPRDIPEIMNYDVWGVNISSKEVGGDYFDIIPISADTFCLAIGDVSGKSVPASLLMANLQAGLRIIIQEKIPLNQIVGNLNNLIYQNTDMDKYITFFVGILNTGTNEFTYVNAGHNPPWIIKKDGRMEALETGGIILGMMPDFNYDEGKIDFGIGDLLYCYTDGVNEAMSPLEEEYGEERLKKLLLENYRMECRLLSDKIVNVLNGFAKGEPQADDITMLLARRLQ